MELCTQYILEEAKFYRMLESDHNENFLFVKGDEDTVDIVEVDGDAAKSLRITEDKSMSRRPSKWNDSL
jgi:hypothetical protein